MKRNAYSIVALACAATFFIFTGGAKDAKYNIEVYPANGGAAPTVIKAEKGATIEHSLVVDQGTTPGKEDVRLDIKTAGGTYTFSDADVSRIAVVKAPDAKVIHEVTDKSAWRILYGTQHGGDGWYPHLIDNDLRSRVGFVPYDPYRAANDQLGNPFIVLDLGREYDIASVGIWFTCDNEMRNCAPRTLKLYYSTKAPAKLSDAAYNTIMGTSDDVLNDASKAAYTEMRSIDAAVSWIPVGSESYKSLSLADYPDGFPALTVSTGDKEVKARYIKVEMEPFGKNESGTDVSWGQGDRPFMYELVLCEKAEPMEAAPVVSVLDKTGWSVLYNTPFMFFAPLRQIIDGNYDTYGSTCVANSASTAWGATTKPYFVVDLGKKVNVAGFKAFSAYIDVMPVEVKMYATDAESLTCPVDASLITKYGCTPDEASLKSDECLTMMNTLTEFDKKVNWTEIGTVATPNVLSEYSMKVADADLLSHPARYVKFEIIPKPDSETHPDNYRMFLREVDVLAAEAPFAPAEGKEEINLAGRWQFLLDRGKSGTPYFQSSEAVTLPGTTETNGMGDVSENTGETTHLTRRRPYTGRAWYRTMVSIPRSWSGKDVWLLLERTKTTTIYVDGLKVGTSNDIATPQQFNLKEWLTPGNHSITVAVDNGSGIPSQIYGSTHAFSEDTQTNWNGIIGQIKLSTSPYTPAPVTEINDAFKDFKAEGHAFYANGHRVFLRGRHDACVWPLTAHTPMDVDTWRSYFKVCQEYGLNHVRFHSWCPPEAAFVAADEAGIYLQPELSFWGDFSPGDYNLMEFLHKEGENILRTYGHHPSFRFFSLGNELWGSTERMAQFVSDFRKIAPDIMYTFGTNCFSGKNGAMEGMDFFPTCRTAEEKWGEYNTHVRSSFAFADVAEGGMINHFRPNASMNFEEGCLISPVPVIGHETGQFQSYPDYAQISKYTGVLRPDNLEVFRSRLEKAGMLDQAGAFHRASGKWATLLYKQDIEMNLRTPSMGGFQLLDIQDYPGQGSAYVGILDAFLDSKGYCTAKQWREWCSEIVPLLKADTYCFTTGEHLTGKLQVANYSAASLSGKQLRWQLGSQSGTFTLPDGEGLIDAGDLNIDLSSVAAPAQMKLYLAVDGTDAANSYDIWVYPAQNDLAALKSQVTIVTEMTDAVGQKLADGATVLYMPGASAQTVGGLFMTDYWNYRMFKTICGNLGKEVSPGTLGILTDPAHPIFKEFPTDEHTNWQWFPVVKNSHPFMLDNTGAAYRPIVQVIDNIERNHKLGLVFEFAVGKGKLLVVMADLEKASEYPEGRQFYTSVLKYMTSGDFNPTTHITYADFKTLLTTPVVEGVIGSLDNITPY